MSNLNAFFLFLVPCALLGAACNANTDQDRSAIAQLEVRANPAANRELLASPSVRLEAWIDAACETANSDPARLLKGSFDFPVEIIDTQETALPVSFARPPSNGLLLEQEGVFVRARMFLDEKAIAVSSDRRGPYTEAELQAMGHIPAGKKTVTKSGLPILDLPRTKYEDLPESTRLLSGIARALTWLPTPASIEAGSLGRQLGLRIPERTAELIARELGPIQLLRDTGGKFALRFKKDDGLYYIVGYQDEGPAHAPNGETVTATSRTVLLLGDKHERSLIHREKLHDPAVWSVVADDLSSI